jgi:hypothetical protein
MMTQQQTERSTQVAAALLILLAILFNAFTLSAEMRAARPGDNDDGFFYVFVERANAAISAGDSPVDHWLPEVELGFPQFFYYQHLPQLAVVALYRVLLRQVSLFRVFNLVRYLLLVLFPVTVYWSMRRMDFSLIAAATGATFSSLLASNLGFGFAFNSYLWTGHGMYTQLWAMHLLFISTACLWRVLTRGTGYAAAVVGCSAVIFSDLMFAYLFAICAVTVWLAVVWDDPGRVRRSVARLVIVAAPVALITSYLTVPFIVQIRYLNIARMEQWKYDSYGALKIVKSLASGHLFDNGRLPVVTLLVFAGVVYAAAIRPAGARLTLSLLAVWLILFCGRTTWGSLADLLPLSRRVLFHRFSAGVDLGAILAVGLAGEWIWNLFGSLSATLCTVAPMTVLLALSIPAFAERWSSYQRNALSIESSNRAFESNSDLTQILSVLRKAPPGRVYAGTRANWGVWMHVGGSYLFNVLPEEGFATVAPWYEFSLNADLLWELNDLTPGIYRAFNIRYIVAPPTVRLGEYLKTILRTRHYTLYEADSGGYAELGQVIRTLPWRSSADLFAPNSKWLGSEEPTLGEFTEFVLDGEKPPPSSPSASDTGSSGPIAAQGEALGRIEKEVVTPDSMNVLVTAFRPVLLVFKVTFHPGWRVTVDGHEQKTRMVSPSFIGVEVSPGHHNVRAEYRSSILKNVLLTAGGVMLVLTIVLHFASFEQRLP